MWDTQTSMLGWVGTEGYGWIDNPYLEGSDAKASGWGLRFVKEFAEKTAVMVAGWQVYGYMNGVMNTDNVSLLG